MNYLENNLEAWAFRGADVARFECCIQKRISFLFANISKRYLN